jgi:hypothetical protein
MNAIITKDEVVAAEVQVVVIAPEQVVETAALASVGGGTAWGAW